MSGFFFKSVYFSDFYLSFFIRLNTENSHYESEIVILS
ncbi:hypothetical protein BN133_4078 [Cronobacter dublinensis 582]|nr:hypothetical protein BN133_4078 [Cronobacter dublinensis 582]